MRTLSVEQANASWAEFATTFERLGLSSYYDMDALHDELLASPCGLTEDTGTAFKGALIQHINMIMALAQRMSKMISGTFQINEDSLLKVCCLMHLSKRYMFEETVENWQISKGILFKFAQLEGCLRSGERSALEALNKGVKITPSEFESMKALDNEETNKNPYVSILTTIVRQANELAYAIEKERYNKIAKN